jgi:hypothetical protein
VEELLKDLTSSINGQNGYPSETNDIDQTEIEAFKEGSRDARKLQALENTIGKLVTI